MTLKKCEAIPFLLLSIMYVYFSNTCSAFSNEKKTNLADAAVRCTCGLVDLWFFSCTLYSVSHL